MSEQMTSKKRALGSMYCRLAGIVGLEEEKSMADLILQKYSDERICICILPVLEDGKHYYLQCNFKRDASDNYMFKISDSFDRLCAQNVLSVLERDHDVEVFLFCSREDMQKFSQQSAFRRVSSKFELVN